MFIKKNNFRTTLSRKINLSAMNNKNNFADVICKDKAGFTLIELVLSIVIIAIGITGCMFALNLSTKHSADPMIIQQASSIAKSYIEEIIAQDFPTSIPCPGSAAANRSTFANICDYNGLKDIGVKKQNGEAIAGLEAYTVEVTIDTSNAKLGDLVAGTEVVGADVAISHILLPQPLRLSGYRTKY